MIRYASLVVAVCLLGSQLWAQTSVRAPEEQEPLLLDMNMQIEATEAVNDMYNFKFARAEQQFRWIKQAHPTHPLPYFLLGLSQWWKIVPNIYETRYDAALLAYMDTATYYAERMLEQNEQDPESAFFCRRPMPSRGGYTPNGATGAKRPERVKRRLSTLRSAKARKTSAPNCCLATACTIITPSGLVRTTLFCVRY